MSEFEEKEYSRVVGSDHQTHFLPGTSIEIVREVDLAEPPRHVLFDFDGTLSLIREGWPEVMAPMMVDVLAATGTDETREELHNLAFDFMMELTGKQTIYQMIRLADEVSKRGAAAEPPEFYKQMYHDRLMERVRSRREDLLSGRAKPEDFLVPGSLDLLRRLQSTGAQLYLASGTDEKYVLEEAAMLAVTPFFGEHIYGAVEDYKTFSKARVIKRILDSNNVDGAGLLGFGDGYVEIQNIKGVGGTAVAVASDETHRSGKPDAWKRDRLIGVGADMVIPDFREYSHVVDYFWA